ncbi:MAG: hypothetical protein PHG06_11900 [Parabacteroides sp.]|nr:hypothetical protein [Parabacteroides sp.]
MILLSILSAGYTVSPRLYTPVSTRSGVEDDDIIDGGWLDEVIITPDDPDPEPDWPDWPGPDWLDVEEPGYGDDGNLWDDLDYWDDSYVEEPADDPLVSAIQQSSTLTSSQQAKLEEALRKLIGEGCMQEALYNALVSENVKLDFGMKTGTAPAAYDPNTKKITFNDDVNITGESLKEELFHAWQDAYYAGGIGQYGKDAQGNKLPGYVNVEFEAKVFKDIARNLDHGCCYIFESDNIPSQIRYAYYSWIESIQNNTEPLLGENYMTWLNLFNQYHPEYSSPTNDNLASPLLLNILINSSNCF